MDQDSSPERSENGPKPPASGKDGTDAGRLDRLPPPIFPMGSRRRPPRRNSGSLAHGTEDEEGSELPADAIISPDEPIRREAPVGARSAEMEDSRVDESAFISPDEPIVRTEKPNTPEDYAEVLGAWSGEEEVEVTGIGESHLSDEDLMALERFGDPHVADLFRALDRLTDQVRAKGQAGLKTSSDMTPFEMSLRAYCVGYLAGRREET